MGGTENADWCWELTIFGFLSCQTLNSIRFSSREGFSYCCGQARWIKWVPWSIDWQPGKVQDMKENVRQYVMVLPSHLMVFSENRPYWSPGALDLPE